MAMKTTKRNGGVKYAASFLPPLCTRKVERMAGERANKEVRNRLADRNTEWEKNAACLIPPQWKTRPLRCSTTPEMMFIQY